MDGGTALKPSFEPIIVARKPFKGSLVDNVIQYGVGGINIDECRVGNEIITQLQKDMTKYHGNKLGAGHHTQMTGVTTQTIGRFPANTILTYDETDFDEVCGGFPNTNGGSYRKVARKRTGFKISGSENNIQEANSPDNYGDSGSASRYFMNCKYTGKDEEIKRYIYTPKASKKDRDCDGTIKNIHPTCKPQTLMQYLVRLVTPNGGTILDPFNGSGSTGKAVMYENKERNKNYKYIGIELTEDYLPISKARIEYVCNLKEEKEDTMQVSFDELLEQEEIWKTK